MLTTNTLRSGFLSLLLAAVGCGGSEDGGPGLGGNLGGGGGGGGGSGDGGAGGGHTDPGGGGGGGGGGGVNEPGFFELEDGGLVCEAQVIRNERVTPDLMIVVDRSASMKMTGGGGWWGGGGGGVNRWDPSVRAVESITSALEDTIRFGLMTFPSNSGCGAGQVNVEVGLNTASAISDKLQNTSPGGYTPTAVTLQNAHEALGSGAAAPDAFVPPKYVLLVTDGAPNCEGGQTGSTQAQESQIVASVEAIEAMAEDGIKTYVIGYDTQNDSALKSALDRMAKAGGTGDQEHRPVEDEDSLRATLEQIAGTAMSCEFQLETPPADASYVEITLDGTQLYRNQPNGWELSEDGRRVTLLGESCDKLKTGGNHTVGVRVLCDIVVPI